MRSIKWLIDWHANETHTAWRNGTLYKYPPDVSDTKATAAMGILGAVAVSAGLLLELFNVILAESFFGFLMVSACIAATVLLWKGGRAAWEKSAGARYGAAQSQHRLAAETQAFQDWERFMADRPTDAEIATWLDYDKAHIKAVAMKQYGLVNRDLVAHVVLAGPADGSSRARFRYGPPRYSKYEVQLFLLTDSGVRQVTVQLELATGSLTNERRRSFRYDAISSAEVADPGFRGDGSRSGASRRCRVFAQEFRLNLNNMQAVHLPVANFDESLVDRVTEDTEHLMELARDTSGVTSALRILEAVAAEGGQWVRQEHQRRRRRMRWTPAQARHTTPVGNGPGRANRPRWHPTGCQIQRLIRRPMMQR